MKVLLAGIYDKTTVSLAPQVLRAYADQFDIPGLEKIVTKEFSLFDRPVESAIDEIRRERPDVVGFSTYIWNIKEVLEIVRHVSASVVLGGPQMTGIERTILERNPNVDVVVSGEGEIAFKELLEYFAGEREIGGVHGITTKDIKTSAALPVILDTIPGFYARIFEENPDLSWINLETSRGCPFGCKYCTWGYDKRMRYFSVDRVKGDLDQILAQDTIKNIYFCDSSLLLRKERAREILRHLIDSGTNKGARYEFDAEHLDDEMIELLSQLPNHEFNFGLQSTNPAALRTMDRRFNRARFEDRFGRIMKRIPKAKVTVDLIYGLPDDSLQGYKASLDYAIGLANVSRVLTNPLIALPGSDFFVNREKHGIKLKDEESYVVQESGSFSPSDMEEARKYSFFVATVFLNHALRDSVKRHAADIGRRPIDVIVDFMGSLPVPLVRGTYPDMIPSEKEDFKNRNDTFKRVIENYREIIDHFRRFSGNRYDADLEGYEGRFSDHFYKLKQFSGGRAEMDDGA